MDHGWPGNDYWMEENYSGLAGELVTGSPSIFLHAHGGTGQGKDGEQFGGLVRLNYQFNGAVGSVVWRDQRDDLSHRGDGGQEKDDECFHAVGGMVFMDSAAILGPITKAHKVNPSLALRRRTGWGFMLTQMQLARPNQVPSSQTPVWPNSR
jgi:hypothetical protein